MSLDTLHDLIREAKVRGYSRNGNRIPTEMLDEDSQYVLTPILPESNPEDSWICILFSYRPERAGEKTQALRRIPHRLDVATRTYAKLHPITGQTKNQLLHSLIWEFTSSSNSSNSPE
ncbi:hypothetical protein [Streptomyces iconiensis]|uniref:Uncharacterized protein n=1 Tax=Streptomyces iconiensis TaxID=1384038 RepID=A0ABT7AAI7_9ACTN|nr:hypothetical protein [Streptomyces iconiensis]MDJ1137623.1 hypothetical protein [Streptomyces iconiensis]